MPPAFKVFLSHQYKSPATNLFFFDLFAEQAVLQFDVDEGMTYQPVAGGLVQKLPTNVTRLERMVRGSDAFVGIYPLSLAATEAPTSDQLLQESRYFRLELDLAIRSGKPGLVLYDKRYKSLFDCPPSFFRCSFDAQEIVRGEAAPMAAALRKTFSAFCESVSASMAYGAVRGGTAESARVGLLLPPRTADGAGYDADQTRAIEQALRGNNYVPVPLPWPPVLGQSLLVAATTLDWIVVDVGDEPASAAAVAFLHGRFVPALRLRQLAPGAAERSRLEAILYGTGTAGYPKDVIRWSTTAELEAELLDRIQVIDLPPRRIGSRSSAESYFGQSAKRPLNVFLSYCGRDEAVAARISEALGRRFQKVFDYKDGKSIRPGEPWLQEIFDQLASASVAIPLLSDEYLKSGNCEHEAREIIARRDNDRLHVIPVKLTPKLTVPTWFADIEFERRFATHGDPEALAQTLVDLVDARAAGGRKVAGVRI